MTECRSPVRFRTRRRTLSIKLLTKQGQIGAKKGRIQLKLLFNEFLPRAVSFVYGLCVIFCVVLWRLMMNLINIRVLLKFSELIDD